MNFREFLKQSIAAGQGKPDYMHYISQGIIAHNGIKGTEYLGMGAPSQVCDFADSLLAVLQEKNLNLLSIGAGAGQLEAFCQQRGVSVIGVNARDSEYDTDRPCLLKEECVVWCEDERDIKPAFV